MKNEYLGFVCIIKRSQTSLILMKKTSEKECTSARHRLDLDISQFVREIV